MNLLVSFQHVINLIAPSLLLPAPGSREALGGPKSASEKKRALEEAEENGDFGGGGDDGVEETFPAQTLGTGFQKRSS